MHRLSQYCLLSVLTGVLTFLPFCWGQGTYDDVTEYTQSTDYDYDSTFNYTFYSNTSIEELDKFLNKNDVGEDMEELESTTVSTTESTRNLAEGSRIAISCFLLTLVFTIHQLSQLL
ncbi:hypothetical protein UPYG_G00338210 [Umbra pygmaea]|uniref:Uncharacterized protein n=1 Tax=Umbra pygmaea TaxID=75934 RepID=A0ABD0WI69_UMBPY